MKDLYTFDATPQEALKAYQEARKAYNAFFDELRIPYLVADADSGSIGGNLSHEYHAPTPNGEDTIISCGSCTYAANEELARSNAATQDQKRSTEGLIPCQSWFGISKDRCQLVEAVLPKSIGFPEHGHSQQRNAQINPHLIKSLYPELDLSIERPLSIFVEHWKENQSADRSQISERLPMPSIARTYDYRISQSFIDHQESSMNKDPPSPRLSEIVGRRIFVNPLSLDLARIQDGDECPKCGNSSLKLQQAVELGHTFYLGDRYSRPMDATFTTSPTQQVDHGSIPGLENQAELAPAKTGQAYFQMGCHGIGISRIVAAVADSLADPQGLIWPRVMAPFEAAILATEEHKATAEEVWDVLTRRAQCSDSVDAVLDDRDRGLGWKLKDADLIGFPVVIVLGSTFSKGGMCEVSIRRLGSREKVAMEDLKDYVTTRLAQI